MYLFDTDALSNVMKKKPSAFLKQKLEEIPPYLQFTSSINIGEIYFGAARTDRKEKLLRAFEEKAFPYINILPFDEESGKLFGDLKARLEKKGIGCSEPDLRIASIALQHDLTLVTGNVKHYGKIPGLKVENWLKY